MKRFLQTALNRFLALDPESISRINALKGKRVAIELNAVIPTKFILFFTETEILLETDSLEKPDIFIKGTPLSLLRLSFSTDKKKFFSDDVTIEGNLELGQQVIDLFDQLDIDWEEQLSHWTGDVPAHQIGRAARSFKQFGERLRTSFTRNMNEYLHEEIDIFPPREALEDFFVEIDDLRMDVDRLEARVLQLQKRGDH